VLLLPIASFHLVMYVAQKEEFEGAKRRKALQPRGVMAKTHTVIWWPGRSKQISRRMAEGGF